MFNPPFLRNINLPVPEWMDKTENSPEIKEALQKSILPKEECDK